MACVARINLHISKSGAVGDTDLIPSNQNN